MIDKILITRKDLIDCYLQWFNDYLTLDLFAEHREISKVQAQHLLALGKIMHEEDCER